MLMRTDTLHGIPIVYSHLATTLASGKPLPFKSWHARRVYAKRIEKKRAKRYGPVTYKPCFLQMRDPITGRLTIVMHPSLAPKLRAALNAHTGEPTP